MALPSAKYDHSYTPPRRTRSGGYVALLDSSGESEIPGTQVVLSRKIRQGFNDLQDISEHVNARIEHLIDRHRKKLKKKQKPHVRDALCLQLRDLYYQIVPPAVFAHYPLWVRAVVEFSVSWFRAKRSASMLLWPQEKRKRIPTAC